jgi:hypothetical protein
MMLPKNKKKYVKLELTDIPDVLVKIMDDAKRAWEFTRDEYQQRMQKHLFVDAIIAYKKWTTT